MGLISKPLFSDQPQREFFTLLFIFILTVLCYGVMIPFLGFYWDDLPYLYQLNTFGPAGFPEYVASDRPFSAWIFMLSTSLFQFTPLGYHLLALVLRFLSSILFFFLLKTVWPKKENFRLFCTVIFTVYPGFLQQPIALIYIHHFSILCLYLLSVILMLRVVTSEKKEPFLYIVSLLTTLHMFSIENFAILELIRPILLWLVLPIGIGNKNERFLKTIKTWLPYLCIFILFFLWRVFIFKFPTYEPGLLIKLSTKPVGALFELAKRIPKDFYTIIFGAWIETFSIPSISSFGTIATYLVWMLVFVSFGISTLSLVALSNKQANKENATGDYWELVVGLLLFLFAGSLVWALDLPLAIEFAWDRLTIGFIPAAALLIGFLANIIFRRSNFAGILFLGLLAAFAVGSHFENNMRYKRDWENLQDLFFQLSWRIPDLENNSAIISSDIGLKYYSDNSLTSPFNLTYSPDSNSHKLDFFFFFTDVRLGLGLPELRKDIPITQGYRSFEFKGNTSQLIAIKNDPPACMKVMDRIYSNSITNLNLTELQTEELRLTNLQLIQQEPQNFPPFFLSKDSSNSDWCFYFQKADLARQFGDYSEIAVLGEQALTSGLKPRDVSEWLPFLEGYSWLGEWDKVKIILDNIFSMQPDYQKGVCYSLRRIKNSDAYPYAQKLSEILKVYNCP